MRKKANRDTKRAGWNKDPNLKSFWRLGFFAGFGLVVCFALLIVLLLLR